MREVLPELMRWWEAGETVGVATVVAKLFLVALGALAGSAHAALFTLEVFVYKRGIDSRGGVGVALLQLFLHVAQRFRPISQQIHLGDSSADVRSTDGRLHRRRVGDPPRAAATP